MSGMDIKSLDQSFEKTKEWLKNYRDELHCEDEQEAYVAMRAVLHALRDRLPVEGAANLAAQLPMMLKGVYYESWKPENKPLKIRDQNEFFEKVASELPQNRQYDSKRITESFMKVMKEHVSGGEIEEIKRFFPQDLDALL
ncbi:MAG: DUF2267 domain-containing protein [Candidatus Omnitrophica bacterium]|nr:DUF2267 domain-containing protein [Candidatus Omnitrophota bacterium]